MFNSSYRRVITASVSKLTYGVLATFEAVILASAIYSGADDLVRGYRIGIGCDYLLISEEIGVLI